MRWSYKTVHFGLKKDGLLGSAFLDDAEIEETLNEFGQGGWELVSMFEARDGVIAVFKQPLELPSARQVATVAPSVSAGRKSATVAAQAESERYRRTGAEPMHGVRREPERDEGPEVADDQYPVVAEYDEEPEVVLEEQENDDGDSGIGAIRIE